MGKETRLYNFDANYKISRMQILGEVPPFSSFILSLSLKSLNSPKPKKVNKEKRAKEINDTLSEVNLFIFLFCLEKYVMKMDLILSFLKRKFTI